MLKQRILTALVLLPVVAGLMLAIRLNYFAAAIAVIVYLVAIEWARLAGFQKSIYASSFAVVVSLINLTLWYTTGGSLMGWPSPSWPQLVVFDNPLVLLGLAVAAIVVASFIVLSYSKLPRWWSNSFIVSMLGLVLLPAFFVALVSVRSVAYLEDFYRGGELLLFMFCLIWAADTGAYFAGKLFGKHKLAPVVSPNKTWEGAIGGFLLSVFVAWLGARWLELDVSNWLNYLLVAAGLAIFSVIGDLFESALKRASHIKDSGHLLPGHGGLLDRLDSTIVVAPLFFLSFSYFGWF